MKSLQEWEEQFKEKDGLAYFNAIKKFARNAVRFKLQKGDEAQIPVGASKMGGLPDLPQGVDWFVNEKTKTPLSFICQVNFAESKEFDLENELPDSGVLYFFYDLSEEGECWGLEADDAYGTKVYYYDGDLAQLERKAAPTELNDDSKGVVFPAARITFETELDLPDYDSDLTCAALDDITEEECDKGSDAFWEIKDGDETISKLLGRPNNVQNAMELEAASWLIEGYEFNFKKENYAKLDLPYAERCVLLLQIDSEDDVDMMWGDCGRLYIWITKEDLKAKNFDKVWLSLQCY